MKKTALISLAAVAAVVATGVVAQAVAQDRADGLMAPPATRAEATQRAADMFARMDANGDGRIDQADRAARHKAMFDRIDANHDGAVSLAEFTAMHDADGADGERGNRGPGQGPDHGREHGPAQGHDRGHGGRGDHGAGPMAAMADTDKDGAVSKAEFTAAALARFDKADSNRDGTLSAAERQAARPMMMRGQPAPQED